MYILVGIMALRYTEDLAGRKIIVLCPSVKSYIECTVLDACVFKMMITHNGIPEGLICCQAADVTARKIILSITLCSSVQHKFTIYFLTF